MLKRTRAVNAPLAMLTKHLDTLVGRKDTEHRKIIIELAGVDKQKPLSTQSLSKWHRLKTQENNKALKTVAYPFDILWFAIAAFAQINLSHFRGCSLKTA